MAACKSMSEWKVPRRMRFRVSTEKKFSTALSHEPEVGVKWNVQRGWRSSQALTFGCLWVASLSTTVAIVLLAGTSRSTVLRKRMNYSCLWRCIQRPITVPSSTLSAANSVVVLCLI